MSAERGIVRDLVFVSYSHEDKRWLDKLRVVLKGYELKGLLQVWADQHILVGDRWEREIGQALARARVGVLLTSANFLASDFIDGVELPALLVAARKDELRLCGVPVSWADPALFGELAQYQWAWPPDTPLDLLKTGQRNKALGTIGKAVVDLFERIGGGATVVRAIAQAPHHSAEEIISLHPIPLASIATLHGVPEPPRHFLPRATAMAELAQGLLAGGQQRFGVSAAGLYGGGGVGKSVLAAAVSRDESVARAFTDVYWLTLGQQPSIVQLQQELWRMATGERVDFESAVLGAARLREQLRYATCLLVLDDAWDVEHVRALDVVGPRSRLLVTTRDYGLLEELGARAHSLDALHPADARELLARWAGVEAAAALPLEAEAIAEECGHLPLALSLAGAQVRHQVSWADVLNGLRAGDLQFRDYAQRGVFKSLDASVRSLPERDLQRYAELAVFPEDTAVPESIIARFWSAADVTEAASRELLQAFAGRALLTLEGGLVKFHDLQGDYLRLVADDLPNAHARLLAACYAALPGAEPGPARWASLPPAEGYLWSQLLYHLVEASDTATAQALVTDVRWLEAKAAASSVSALLTDLATLAERAPSPEIRQIERALRLEGGWLHQDPGALPGLLYNRLRCDGWDAPAIAQLTPQLHPPVRLIHPVRMGSAERRIFRGHTSFVVACVYSPDGTCILSASHDRTLREWDRKTGQEIRRFVGHSDVVNACVYAPDGTRVLSASRDGTVREWDRATRDEVHRFDARSSRVSACAYSPDGARVLFACDDGTMREWNRTKGDEVCRFESRSGALFACAYSPDGARVLSACKDGTVREWDRATRDEVHRFEGHSRVVRACVYSPDGVHVLSASADGTVREWDRATRDEVHRFEYSDAVSACAYSPDGTSVLAVAWDNTVREWDRATGREVRRFEGHSSPVSACAYSPDGLYALSASNDGTVREWDRAGGVAGLRLEGHSGSVGACVWSPDGDCVLSAGQDGTMRDWDRQTGTEIRRFDGDLGKLSDCSYSPDGARVLSASDKGLHEFDRATGEELRPFKGANGGFQVCAYSSDGRRVLAANFGTIWEWDRVTEEEPRRFKHAGSFEVFAFSSDGARVLSSVSRDGGRPRPWANTVLESDLATGEEVRRFEGHTSLIYCCTYSPDNKRVLSASWDKTLREWDRTTGRELRRFEGHSSLVQACSYSLDGAHILSASQDNTLKIWDVATGRCLYTIYGVAAFHSLAVDSRRIAAGDLLGNVWILDCDLLGKPPSS